MDGALPSSKFRVRHLVGSRPAFSLRLLVFGGVGGRGGRRGEGTPWGDVICMFSYFVPTWQVYAVSLVSHIAYIVSQ